MTEINAANAEALLREHYTMVYRYARSMLPLRNRAEDAEDLVQQVFLIALSKLAFEPPEGAPGPWLRGITRRLILARRSRLASLTTAQYERIMDMADHALEDPFDREAFARCLSLLPEEERNLLRLRYTHNLPAEDISRRVQRSRNWVYVRLHRIREKLRECIEKHGATG